MADSVVTLPGRGKTYLKGPNRTPGSTYGVSVAIEGIRKVFKDVDYSSTDSIKPPRSGGEVECILVRNTSGTTLLPGRVCVWASTYQGRRVDGYTSLDQGQPVAGIVDEFLPTAGVADDDLFWLVVKGPALIKKALSAATLAKDDFVVAITAATSQATTAGRIMSIASTSNATNGCSQVLNRIGIAMSTSATTDANVLVYVDLI
jgi:hypothetical protein